MSKIKEILVGAYGEEKAGGIIARGIIDFGCNPRWDVPNALRKLAKPGTAMTNQRGRSSSKSFFVADDGEIELEVSYETDFSD